MTDEWEVEDMTISNLIDRLQELMGEYGDIVVRADRDSGWPQAITDVVYLEADPTGRHMEPFPIIEL